MLGHITKPPAIYTLMELRAFWEVASLMPALPLLKQAPKGNYDPVLVMPGFMTSDNATYVLRRFLDQQGYRTYPWQLGRNPGLRNDIYQRLEAKVLEIHADTGRKVSLIGWSLGGVYARILGHRISDSVARVITLGSPFAITANSTVGDEQGISGPVLKLYEMLNPDFAADTLLNGEPVWAKTPPVPSSAIYSESDGIAAWQHCVEEQQSHHTENIRVNGSHCGLTHNPAVLYAICDRLAQHPERWQPFRQQWLHRLIYSDSFE